MVIIDCSAWPWEPLYQPTIDELLTVVDTAGNPIITLDEACGYTNFPIDFDVMSGGCNYDHQLVYYPVDDCGNEGDSLYQVIQVDDFTDPVFTSVPADTMIACTEDVMAYFEMATAEDACDPSVNMTFEDEIVPSSGPADVTFTYTTDQYGSAEAYAVITDSEGMEVASYGLGDFASNATIEETITLDAGTYTITLGDDWGDGCPGLPPPARMPWSCPEALPALWTSSMARGEHGVHGSGGCPECMRSTGPSMLRTADTTSPASRRSSPWPIRPLRDWF